MSLRQKYLDFLQRKPNRPEEHVLWAVLRALAHVYQLGWWTRRLAYQLRMVPRSRLSCPVISVGNLTTGGTGKTPVVIHLADHFTARGLRVAVLSRGYGGKRRGTGPLWVSDGERLLSNAAEAGDEPVLIARKVPQAAMLVCPDRYRAGQEALRRFKPDLIILDDGFQRRYRLHRDMDLLVVDGTQPFSTGRVLPAGLLREPMDALAEAGVFIINKADQARNVPDIRTMLAKRNPRAPVIESQYKPVGLKDMASGRRVKSSQLEGIPVGALSGIGNPHSFVRTLESFKVLVRHAYALGDHYVYTKRALREIVEDARRRGLLYLVTTEKDEVKLPRELGEEIPVLVLEIEWHVTGGKNHWQTLLKSMEWAGGKR